MSATDPYFHRTVALRTGGRRLELATSQELFSSHQVDRGSRLLLRVIAEVTGDELADTTVLDVGCGYGPLGLGLRAMGTANATLVDRDALAVRYAAANAEANGLDGVVTSGSLGYDDVAASFGLVVSNVPGHASPAVIRHFVQGASRALEPRALAAFVVVTTLATWIDDVLASAGATVARRVEDRGHSVVVARFDNARAVPPVGLALYRRGQLDVEVSGRPWTVETVEGVPEFERLSHHTAALLHYLATHQAGAESIAVWNPGHGHVPIFLNAGVRPRRIVLADRDLLALRSAKANLVANGVPPELTSLVHDVDLSAAEDGLDLVVDVLRRREPADAAAERISHARSMLAPGGALLVTGPGSSARRVEAALVARGIGVRRLTSRRTTLLRIPG